MHIYVLRGREQQGPFSPEEINLRLAASNLSLSDLALPQGATQWVPLHEIAGVGLAPVPPPSGEQKGPATVIPPRLQHRLELDALMRAQERIEARKDRNEHARNWCVTSVLAAIALLGTALVLGNQEGQGLAMIVCLVAMVGAGVMAAHFYTKIESFGAPLEKVTKNRGTLATFNAWVTDLRLWVTAIALFVFLGITIYRDIKVSRGNYDAIHRGMTKAEVRAVLGDPTDVTEATFSGGRVDQWTYAAVTTTSSKVILIDFENNRVADKTWGGSHY